MTEQTYVLLKRSTGKPVVVGTWKEIDEKMTLKYDRVWIAQAHHGVPHQKHLWELMRLKDYQSRHAILSKELKGETVKFTDILANCKKQEPLWKYWKALDKPPLTFKNYVAWHMAHGACNLDDPASKAPWRVLITLLGKYGIRSVWRKRDNKCNIDLEAQKYLRDSIDSSGLKYREKRSVHDCLTTVIRWVKLHKDFSEFATREEQRNARR